MRRCHQQQHRVRDGAWLAQQPQRTLWASRDGGQHGDLTCECAVHQARGCGACWHIMSPCSRRRHSWVCTLAVRVLQVRSRARRPITRQFVRCFSARRPTKVIIHADTICGRGRGRRVHGHTFAAWTACRRVATRLNSWVVCSWRWAANRPHAAGDGDEKAVLLGVSRRDVRDHLQSLRF